MRKAQRLIPVLYRQGTNNFFSIFKKYVKVHFMMFQTGKKQFFGCGALMCSSGSLPLKKKNQIQWTHGSEFQELAWTTSAFWFRGFYYLFIYFFFFAKEICLRYFAFWSFISQCEQFIACTKEWLWLCSDDDSNQLPVLPSSGIPRQFCRNQDESSFVLRPQGYTVICLCDKRLGFADEGCWVMLKWIVMAPICMVLYFSIPDCRKERWAKIKSIFFCGALAGHRFCIDQFETKVLVVLWLEVLVFAIWEMFVLVYRWDRWFMATFLMSIVWIAIFSYIMVWMVSKISFRVVCKVDPENTPTNLKHLTLLGRTVGKKIMFPCFPGCVGGIYHGHSRLHHGHYIPRSRNQRSRCHG